MTRTPEAESFFRAVYTAVQEIPRGKITSYGHIALLIGTPERPRQVGVCLKHLPTDPEARYNNQNVPWQRVINAKGEISPRSTQGGTNAQADALRSEGVTVEQDAMGKYSVDLGEYGWFPPILPSDLAEMRGDGAGERRGWEDGERGQEDDGEEGRQAAQVDWGEVQDRDERLGLADSGPPR